MSRLRERLLKAAMILTLCALPGGGVECDLEDGEFEIDWPDRGGGGDYCCDDGYFVDVWYDYWYPCCW